MPRHPSLITHQGQTMPIKAWAATMDLSSTTIRMRLDRGLPLEKVFTKGRLNAAGRLTERRHQCLMLMARGEPTKRIADMMGVCIGTASKHRQSILDHFNTSDTTSAVIQAIKKGQITLEEI